MRQTHTRRRPNSLAIAMAPSAVLGVARCRVAADGSISRLRIGPWVAYAAAFWALVFACFHIVWAIGWYPPLDAEGAREAFANPWKWAYDVLVAARCIIAVPVALAPVMSWGQRGPRRLIYSLAWIGSALLVLRSVASLMQASYFIVTGRFRFADMGIWSPGSMWAPFCSA
jgi:hypothetical protein